MQLVAAWLVGDRLRVGLLHAASKVVVRLLRKLSCMTPFLNQWYVELSSGAVFHVCAPFGPNSELVRVWHAGSTLWVKRAWIERAEHAGLIDVSRVLAAA